MTEDYSKDFGYLLQENNVIGGVANGVDQIYGVMIMSDSLNMMTVLPRKFRDNPDTTLAKIPAQGSMKKEYNFPRKVSVLNYNHLNLHELHSILMIKERGLNMINGIDGVRETLNEKFPFKTIISLNGIRLHNTGEEKK